MMDGLTMDGWTDEQIKRWMDGWMDRRMDGRTNKDVKRGE